MKHYFLIIILLIASHIAKANDSEEFIGGHPLIITRIWNDQLTHEQGNEAQKCVESKTVNDEISEDEVLKCINGVK